MSDLLKEAIADAKAVRETALQNAKMALEEAFTPHLKSMLSAKLAEDDIEEDDNPFADDEEEEVEDEVPKKVCTIRLEEKMTMKKWLLTVTKKKKLKNLKSLKSMV